MQLGGLRCTHAWAGGGGGGGADFLCREYPTIPGQDHSATLPLNAHRARAERAKNMSTWGCCSKDGSYITRNDIPKGSM